MNVGITDLNRDGLPDVYISNIVTMDKDEKYVLPDHEDAHEVQSREDGQHARRRGQRSLGLVAQRQPAGLVRTVRRTSAAVCRSTGWAWDADFFDFDNDGDDDLYVVNGMNEYAVYSSVNPYLTDSERQSVQRGFCRWRRRKCRSSS